ncbi:MAG: S-layer homology domain-containing protein [Clostridia bacterium]|nr:S-layer homology domain-containing protein [Clostridia bacterium]
MIKNKRLLSFIVSVVFIVTCFPALSGSASTIPVYDEDYENSAFVLNTICPDFPLADSEVTTRAEFVAAVCMVLNMPQKTVGHTGFSDVSADSPYAPYISYARDLGLISSVDLFYPDSPVTYEQAIKIVMSAAGYGRKAEIMGGYPVGYIRCANDAGVGKGVSAGGTDPISHKLATQLIFEASITDMMEISSFGDSVDYTVTEGKNILSVYHGIYTAEGVVSANEYTGTRSISASCPEGFITVDGEFYKGDGFADLLGKNIRLFYKDSTKNEIVCAYECNNTIFEYTENDAITLSDTDFKVFEEGSVKDTLHKLEDDYTIIYNGKCFNTAKPGLVVNPDSGSVTLVDNNDNSKIDVIVVREVEYGVVGSVNVTEEKIYDKYKKGGTTDLSQTEFYVKDSDGTKIELGDLEEDNTIGFVISKDNKLCEIIRYSEKVGGVLEEVTSDNKIVVGGNEYKLSRYYTENIKTLSQIKLGSEVILNLGEANKVCYVSEFADNIKYGFFVGAGTDSGLDSNPRVMIFGEDGAMHEIPVAQKVKIDGVPKTQSEAYTVLDAIEAKPVLMRVVKYSLNAKGELNAVYQTKENTEGTKVFLTRTQSEAQPILYDDNTKHGYTGSEGKLVYKNGVFYPYFAMSPDCVILKVPSNEESRYTEKHYSLLSETDIKSFAQANGDSIECYGYDVDMNGASLILWPNDQGGSTNVAEETANVIVEKVTRGATPDDEECYVLTLFADGKADKYYSTTDSEAVVSTMKPGDIVQVSYNADKEITAANINFVWLSKQVTGNAQAPQGYNGARVGLAAGYVYNFSGSTGMIVRNKTITEIANATTSFAHTDMFPISLNRGKVYYVKFNYDRQTGAVLDAVVHTENGNSSIESFYSTGTDADYIVQRARFHDVSYTIVYTN